MLSKAKWAIFLLLMLCGGSIYKLVSIKDAFYLPLQHYLHLTNGQIGNVMSINSLVVTIGYFISIIMVDKLPRRLCISLSFMTTGLLGLWFSTLPHYSVILFIWALFGLTCDMFNWPLILKSVSSLGDNCLQGRLFGLFEMGHGIVDSIIAFTALVIFTYLGGELIAFKGAIYFLSSIVMIVGILVFIFLKDPVATPVIADHTLTSQKAKSPFKTIIKNKFVWLVAINIFFVYAVYCGLTYFIPMLKDIFDMPVALVGAYGIINQYCLKMIGGPIGGLISDKVLHSPTRYLFISFLFVTLFLIAFILFLNSTLNTYLATLFTLLFGAIVFTQRSIFFAPMGEINISEEIKGSAMGLASFVGYSPAMFCFSLYGHIIDQYQGLLGYKVVFSIMAGFAIFGMLASLYLRHLIKKNQQT